MSSTVTLVFLIDPSRTTQLQVVQALLSKLLVFHLRAAAAAAAATSAATSETTPQVRWTFQCVGSQQRPTRTVPPGKQSVQRAVDVVRQALAISRNDPAPAALICDSVLRLQTDVDWGGADDTADRQPPLRARGAARRRTSNKFIYVLTRLPRADAEVGRMLQLRKAETQAQVSKVLQGCFSQYDALGSLQRSGIALRVIDDDVSMGQQQQQPDSGALHEEVRRTLAELMQTTPGGSVVSARSVLTAMAMFGTAVVGTVLCPSEQQERRPGEALVFVASGDRERTVFVWPLDPDAAPIGSQRWQVTGTVPGAAVWRWQNGMHTASELLVEMAGDEGTWEHGQRVHTLCSATDSSQVALLVPLCARAAVMRILTTGDLPACCNNTDVESASTPSSIESWRPSISAPAIGTQTFRVVIAEAAPEPPPTPCSKTPQRTPRSTRKTAMAMMTKRIPSENEPVALLEQCTTAQQVYDWLDDVVCDTLYCNKMTIRDLACQLLPRANGKLQSLGGDIALQELTTLLHDEYLLPLDRFTAKHKDGLANVLRGQDGGDPSGLKPSELEAVAAIREQLAEDTDAQRQWLAAVKQRECLLQIVLLLHMCALRSLSGQMVTSADSEDECVRQLDLYVGRLSIWCSTGSMVLDKYKSARKCTNDGDKDEDDELQVRRWMESVVIPAYHSQMPELVDHLYRSCGGEATVGSNGKPPGPSPLRFRIAPRRSRRPSDSATNAAAPPDAALSLSQQLYGRARMEVALQRPKQAQRLERKRQVQLQKQRQSQRGMVRSASEAIVLSRPDDDAVREAKRQRRHSSANRRLFPIHEHGAVITTTPTHAVLEDGGASPMSPLFGRQPGLPALGNTRRSLFTPAGMLLVGRQQLGDAVSFAERLGGHSSSVTRHHHSESEVNPFAEAEPAAAQEAEPEKAQKVPLRPRSRPNVVGLMRRYQQQATEDPVLMLH
ncbi:hypothetical protein RI367_001806 [Sorochytrium milnesiophthora]